MHCHNIYMLCFRVEASVRSIALAKILPHKSILPIGGRTIRGLRQAFFSFVLNLGSLSVLGRSSLASDNSGDSDFGRPARCWSFSYWYVELVRVAVQICKNVKFSSSYF